MSRYIFIGTEKDLIDNGFEIEFKEFRSHSIKFKCATKDIGVYCDVMKENETLFVSWDKNLNEQNKPINTEISFNGNWIEDIYLEDFIQDLIDKRLIKEKENVKNKRTT